MDKLAPTPQEQHPSTDSAVCAGAPPPKQAELPGVEGYASNGADPALVDLPIGVGLSSVEGVRVGARWRRDSEGGAQLALPWAWIEDRRLGLEQHRGREWSHRDLEIRAAIEAQTWNVADVGQRSIKLPVWLQVDGFDDPRTGDPVIVPKNPRARMLLAIVWDAFVRGTGGVLLTRVQWAQVLGCSPRSVYNYQRELMDLGLLRRYETWVPAVDEFRNRICGSTHSALLLRIGPALDALAPMAFEHSKPPRRQGFSQSEARRLGGAVRRRARGRAREIEGRHWASQAKWSGRSAARPRTSSTPRARRRPTTDAALRAASVSRPRRALVERPEHGRAPMARPSASPGVAAPERLSVQRGARSTWQKMPTTPPPPPGGAKGVVAQKGAVGASPEPHSERSAPRSHLSGRSGAATPGEADGRAIGARPCSGRSTSATTPPENASQGPQGEPPSRSPSGSVRRDALSEIARAIERLGARAEAGPPPPTSRPSSAELGPEPAPPTKLDEALRRMKHSDFAAELAQFVTRPAK